MDLYIKIQESMAQHTDSTQMFFCMGCALGDRIGVNQRIKVCPAIA